MPQFRRALVPGGTFFFTVVTAHRAPIFRTQRAVALLRRATADTRSRWPFEIQATVVLPDHLHAIWTLPDEDADFSQRWAFLKKTFTHLWLHAGGSEQKVTSSQQGARRRGVWQRRFWEHVIRNERDFGRHCDYIHFNPVKHGVASCPHAWPYSSFHKWVREGVYKPDWLCACGDRETTTPKFDDLQGSVGE
jgi:putative transposase